MSDSLKVKKFSAQLENLREMLFFIKSVVTEIPFDHKTITRIELVAEEALTNVIHHAYPEEKKGFIEVSCGSGSGKKLTIVIKDYGIPFDPVAKLKDVDTSHPPEEVTYGGYGLFFIRKIMDEIHYERSGNANIFRMEKGL